MHAYEAATRGLRKNHQKGLELCVQYQHKIYNASMSQTEKLNDLRDTGQSIQKGLNSVVENNYP